jgi:hypothetical protein
MKIKTIETFFWANTASAIRFYFVNRILASDPEPSPLPNSISARPFCSGITASVFAALRAVFGVPFWVLFEPVVVGHSGNPPYIYLATGDLWGGQRLRRIGGVARQYGGLG